jgi:hypothetical protein
MLASITIKTKWRQNTKTFLKGLHRARNVKEQANSISPNEKRLTLGTKARPRKIVITVVARPCLASQKAIQELIQPLDKDASMSIQLESSGDHMTSTLVTNVAYLSRLIQETKSFCVLFL